MIHEMKSSYARRWFDQYGFFQETRFSGCIQCGGCRRPVVKGWRMCKRALKNLRWAVRIDKEWRAGMRPELGPCEMN